jgi:hypothetical protein
MQPKIGHLFAMALYFEYCHLLGIVFFLINCNRYISFELRRIATTDCGSFLRSRHKIKYALEGSLYYARGGTGISDFCLVFRKFLQRVQNRNVC